LGLILRKDRARSDRVGCSSVEIVDLDVQVRHHLLIAGTSGPGTESSASTADICNGAWPGSSITTTGTGRIGPSDNTRPNPR
jgi:hypothetical protein